MLSTVTRLPAGFNTEMPGSPLADFRAPSPYRVDSIASDFNTFTAAQWTLSGTGAAALAIGGDLGRLDISTANTGNETSLQLGAPTLAFTPDILKDLFFKVRLRCDQLSTGRWIAGLMSSDTTPIGTAPTNGLYFQKGLGTTTPIQAILRIGGANVATVALGPMPGSNVYSEFTLAYTAANGMLYAFQDDAQYLLAANPTTLGSSALGPAFSVDGTSATTYTLGIDFYRASKGR
jgi:hypothetical protein